MIIYLSSPQILIGHYFLSCVSIIWLFWCDKLTNSGMWGLLVWENFYCSFSFVGSFFRVRVLVGGFFSQHFKYFTPLSFCLQSFWGEVVCYSYICFSIGKAFYPSGSFQNFVFVWKWWTYVFRKLLCIILNPSNLTLYSKYWAVTSSIQISTTFSREQYNNILSLSLFAYSMGNLKKPALHNHVQLEACSAIMTNGRQEVMDKCFPLSSSFLWGILKDIP